MTTSDSKPKQARPWRIIVLLSLETALAACSQSRPTPPGPGLAWAYPTSAEGYTRTITLDFSLTIRKI
jgi:hypothetical protein